MIRSSGLVCALLLLVTATSSNAQPPADRDWSEALRTDARALHDDIAANHPGPVNPRDPNFARRNDAQLALALERARDSRTYADYFFALREYVASFNDGHMGFGAFGNTPNDARWPGFATEYDGQGKIRVFQREEDAPVPVGAQLLGCDGLTAAQYAAATLGRMWGRWQLESQHLAFGRMLFLTEGSRYIPRARQCTFEVDGRPRTVTLAWRPIEVRRAFRLMAPTGRPPRTFDSRTLADGTRWFAIPSFDANPLSPAGRALPAMIARMRTERASLAAAPAIVLDLRGNGGGSSDWSRQIAEILWGPAAIRALPSPEIHVDWRVSRANLEAVEQGFAQQNEGGSLSPAMRHWFETAIRNLRASLARGDQLWRHVDDDAGPDEAAAGHRRRRLPPPAGRVYFVTDASCGSACLDAVDLWRALGAIHVGRTTSADTLYMEVRQFRLPSGVAAVSMPMKVYQGRPRGSNEPVVPQHIFPGDIADTAALEQWVASLAPARRR